MKHAYLIIAHDNFHVLEYLIETLDDYRNDIYLHIDKKVDVLPDLVVKKSNLILLEQRIDVKWGTLSQIECEYLLFEKASKSHEDYLRYNLISGTHFPLKSQDYIYNFFKNIENVQAMSFMYTNDYEINFKLGYFHLLVSNFSSQIRFFGYVSRLIWRVALKFQKTLKIKRKLLPVKIKASNWISLTPDAVLYVLSMKEHIISRFKFTLCGDEFFIPYLLTNNQNFLIKNEPLLLYTDFGNESNPRFLESKDVDFLIGSDYLFARKFSDINLIKRIKSHLNNSKSNIN